MRKLNKLVGVAINVRTSELILIRWHHYNLFTMSVSCMQEKCRQKQSMWHNGDRAAIGILPNFLPNFIHHFPSILRLTLKCLLEQPLIMFIKYHLEAFVLEVDVTKSQSSGTGQNILLRFLWNVYIIFFCKNISPWSIW